MKIFLMALAMGLCSCASIEKKSWASASSADAFKITVTDPSYAQPLPSLIAGGGSHSVIFALPTEKGKHYPTIWAYARRFSLWGIFSDTSSGNITFTYCAGTNETPEQTRKNLEIIAKIVNGGK